jgi:hypothetical protein
MIGETPETPVNVRLAPADIRMGKLVMVGLFTLAPVAIAILMQNPALRQAIEMKAWNTARGFCRRNARLWANLESIAATRYDVARL